MEFWSTLQHRRQHTCFRGAHLWRNTFSRVLSQYTWIQGLLSRTVCMIWKILLSDLRILREIKWTVHVYIQKGPRPFFSCLVAWANQQVLTFQEKERRKKLSISISGRYLQELPTFSRKEESENHKPLWEITWYTDTVNISGIIPDFCIDHRR